jgi:dinuclear metal center YbgI/SA1388 family protein
MTVKELYTSLNDMIPTSLSCEWDNDGLMCCPDASAPVRRVLVALDVTEDTVNAAIKGEYDLIVSHHPLVFKGIKHINDGNGVARKLLALIKNGISVFSFHTRLDALSGGVNDTLADVLGIENAVAFGEEGIGRIGYLPEPLGACELAKQVKTALGADGVYLSDAGIPCRRVAVLGGGGGDDLGAAIAAGADTYVTGELKYHQLVDAPELGINLIEAGHYFTEQPICSVLARMIRAVDPDIACDVIQSNKIQLI